MFTFCISTHNNINYLKLSLDSIISNSYYLEFPIFVYAEGCTDGTNEYLESLNVPNLEFEIKPERWDEKYWGIGGGMNRCAEMAKTEYILFTHSDMYHPLDWDKHLFEKIKSLGRSHVVSPYRVEPKIFPYGQVSKYGTIVVPPQSFGEYHYNFQSLKFEKFSYSFVKDNLELDIPMLQGVQFIIHKDDWMDNDPIFAPTYMEDMDLFIRMKQKQYTFHTIGSSLVYHFGARGSHFPDDNLELKSDRQSFSEIENKIKFKKKWGKLFTLDKYGMPVI